MVVCKQNLLRESSIQNRSRGRERRDQMARQNLHWIITTWNRLNLATERGINRERNKQRNKPSNKASNAAHQFPLKIKFCFRFSALFFHEQASIYLSRLSDANGYMIIKNKHQKSCNAHEMSIEKSHSYIRNNPRYEEFSSYHKGRLYLSCPHE